MAAAEKYHLVVSGLMGTVYIAKLTKTPHLMSQDRRQVPPEEFLQAVLTYTLSRLKENSDTLTISVDDKIVAEIVIKDRKALTGR